MSINFREFETEEIELISPEKAIEIPWIKENIEFYNYALKQAKLR